MSEITDPYYASDENYTDPGIVEQDAFNKERAEHLEEMQESEAQQETTEPTSMTEGGPDTLHPIGKAVKGVAETALQPVLGVGDFASDVVGLVPWLRPIDELWDENSYRSTHPGHTLIRDSASIIIPTMVGGGAVVGKLKASKLAMSLPKYANTLGKVAAYTGVDTGVAMISSHSKTDANLAGTLHDWLGWNIPWATRSSDSADVTWKKNVMEAAGFAGGVELIGAAFTFGRKAKLFPRDEIADQAINARKVKEAAYEDPVTAAIEPRREARKAAQTDEMMERLKADPTGEQGYDAFINDIGDDSAGKAVQNLEADPLKAKLDQTLIQRNLDTYNGRATSVVDDNFMTRFRQAISVDDRAAQLDDLFSRISPNFDAVVNRTTIAAEEINRGVDNLTTAIFGKDISFQEFEKIVDNMKSVTFNSNSFLSEDDWITASRALKESYEKIFDPNQMRASAMLTQQAADNITDAATAGLMLGEAVDTSRQMELMFKKLSLLSDEVKVNQYITSKAQEYRKLVQAGDEATALGWLQRQPAQFNEFLNFTKAKTTKAHEFFQKTAKENPNYYRAFHMLYDKTNGNVDQIHKMHAWAENKIGLMKKGIFDQKPEVPSIIVQGMQTARVNSILMGLSPGRAGVSNASLITIKPISVFAGAAMTGDMKTLRRAAYTYAGIIENVKRGFKVMGDEWHNATKHPEEMGMRGRADLKQAKIEDMEILDEIAEGWRTNGEKGKLAMYNVAKGLTWWNNQSWTKMGTSALYAMDGFLNSFMASLMSRARAYDTVLENTKGAIDWDKMNQMQRDLYSEAFDKNGVLTNKAAKEASKEFALNLDNKVVQKFDDFLEHFPAARGLFLFPRTGINALELSWSFMPGSSLAPALTRAKRVLSASTDAQKMEVLIEHGLDVSGQSTQAAWNALRNEYIGRQIMGSSVIMGAGMLALEGSLTGNGPQDGAEKRRMMEMGWQPQSIRNPLTGQWHSYRGFEPFDKMLGLTADIVYQSNRVDQAVTEDMFRKAAYAISMNLTNSTFLSGMNPVAGLISGDPGAWNRFTAQQVDQVVIPFRGIRSILNNAITPQLKDVENDFWAYMKNANKFLFSGNEQLQNLMDVYTGKPIKYFDPFTAAFNATLPIFKQNGNGESWREWLLATGWDGLQNPRRNKITKQPLTTQERYFINNWIAKNADLKGQIIKLMHEDDGYWTKELRKYAKERGLKSQAEMPIKEFFLHRELDRIHDDAFDAAWDALEARNFKFTALGREVEYRNWQLQRGRVKDAKDVNDNVNRLLRNTRNK